MTDRRRTGLLAGFLLLLGGCATPPTAPSAPPQTTVLPAPIDNAPAAALPAPAPKPVVPFSPIRHDPVAWKSLPGWQADRVNEAWPALRESCRALVSRRAAVPWLEVCRAADTMPQADPLDAPRVRAFFDRPFQPYRLIAVDTDGTEKARGLITGSY